MTPMTCRNCGAGLTPDAAGRPAGLIVCSHCGSVHERPVAAVQPAPDAPAAPAAAPRRIAQPERFTVKREKGALRVAWRKGRAASGLILGVFALVWFGMALMSGAWPLLIMVPLLGYYALVRGLNRLTLHVDAAALVLRQGPMPWPGATRLARSDIAQMYTVEKVSTTRQDSNGGGELRTRRHYRLCARLKDGTRKNVVRGLQSVDQALWLERETEQALGIADAPVDGEFRR